MPTEPAAHAQFDALRRRCRTPPDRLGEPLGTLWTRATEKARKLALILACSRDAHDWRIQEPAARWACNVSRYLTQRLVYLASQWVAENPFDAKRKRVLRMIVEAGELGLSRSAVYAKTQGMTTRERAELFEALQLCGDVIEVKEMTTGIPRVRYVAAEFHSGASS